MWSPDALSRIARAGLPALAGLALLAGCTAQPLYSSSVSPAVDPGPAAGSTRAAIGRVNVAPVTTRDAQEVRNELIFQLSGGRGNPPGAPYTLALSAYSFSDASTVVNTTGVEQAPTSSILTFVGSYQLMEAATGRIVGSGQRRATASYDAPRQPLASERALRDAQNRAARELAAYLVAAVATDLATGQRAAPPPATAE